MIYTAFCQDTSGRGTIWIDKVEASTVEDAKNLAREACADDWGYEDASQIHVLGIARGNVEIADWEDLGD